MQVLRRLVFRIKRWSEYGTPLTAPIPTSVELLGRVFHNPSVQKAMEEAVRKNAVVTQRLERECRDRVS